MTRKLILTALPLIFVAGCATMNEPMSSDFGIASANNFLEQVPDPSPMPDLSGADARQSDAAIARYRAGQVKRPRSLADDDDG